VRPLKEQRAFQSPSRAYQLLVWAPDPAIRKEKILVDNAAALYGF